ncbi:glycosyltransferase family 25 protein [Pelagimonas varians]|uniref:Glycosyltransferase family 25 (LPS biosynthesis protein) n=1 Tax=Pelagimonas varians TaxID=696760 RepID=A0A238L2J5_9RHOB|nr:glycosyltransferase family 25 protein [Pelagimonas varians]PYG27157.1 glycosyl transferase family 25 [Pelagimonas varians]SMX48652.1 Glycosyltransferase family 25 (LPS biosynthesis protein) [Pelagimonas varians]
MYEGRQTPWSFFDKIYVVSLPSSLDRRAYVGRHLADLGIEGFVYHDACGPDHPDVKKIVSANLVHQYPPCFRCGKLSCGRADCNNQLIGPQVAVFASYLNLWKTIAATPQRALVLEDDVQIHPWWPKVLDFLSKQESQGRIEFAPDQPRLLRLGWGMSADHDDTACRLEDKLRMSNPAHALTSAYAQALLDRFEGVNHTADVFIHRDAPKPGEALTVFPPIASELSWSDGRFSSLIHPRNSHAAYLEAQGQSQKASAYRDLVKTHMTQVAHTSKEN